MEGKVLGNYITNKTRHSYIIGSASSTDKDASRCQYGFYLRLVYRESRMFRMIWEEGILMEVVLRQTSQKKRKVSLAVGGWLFWRFD